MSENKHDSGKAWIDPDDAPELSDDWFEKADLYQGTIRVRRGRPKSASTKVLLSVRYSPEVVEYFKSTGEGWQTRMDEVLQEYVQTHRTTSPL